MLAWPCLPAAASQHHHLELAAAEWLALAHCRHRHLRTSESNATMKYTLLFAAALLAAPLLMVAHGSGTECPSQADIGLLATMVAMATRMHGDQNAWELLSWPCLNAAVFSNADPAELSTISACLASINSTCCSASLATPSPQAPNIPPYFEVPNTRVYPSNAVRKSQNSTGVNDPWQHCNAAGKVANVDYKFVLAPRTALRLPRLLRMSSKTDDITRICEPCICRQQRSGGAPNTKVASLRPKSIISFETLQHRQLQRGLAHSGDCTFELSTCNWTESGKHAWTRGTRTPSSGTGASKAHGGKHFMYLETSNGQTGDASYLISPTFKAPAGGTMAFYYHMHGASMGVLSLENYATKWSTLWSKRGQQHSSTSAAWTHASVKLPPGTTRVRFKGTKGSSYTGDMSVDSVTFSLILAQSTVCTLRTGGLGTLPALIGGGASANSCCVPGSDWDLVDGSACAACQPGHYDHDADAATPCISCPAGRFSNLTGATSCDVCQPRTYSHVGESACARCRSNPHGRGINFASCQGISTTSSVILRCRAPACEYQYNGIPGSSVRDLISSPKYPSAPDRIVPIRSGVFHMSMKGDNLGVMMEGFLLAPISGQYTFSTYSDDASVVWVATQPNTQSSLTKAVELDPGCCHKVQGTVRVHWTVNNTYYLRALIKEGGGGEYLQVGMSVGGKEYYPIPIAMFQVPTSSKQCALRRGGLGTLPALIGGGAYAKSCCMSGTDWNLVDGSACAVCQLGQYDHDADAATQCISCPAGRFSNLTGATSCGVCQPGTYAPAASTGASNCTACHPGQYDHDADAATPCISCPAGRFSNLTGATSCDVCQPRTYSHVGESACARCRSNPHGRGINFASCQGISTTSSVILRCRAPACEYQYNGIPGSSVRDLISSPKYPSAPDRIVPIRSGVFHMSMKGDNLGVMMEGFLLAPISGQYTFSTYSDDASVVWVATQPNTQSSLTKAVELDPGCCHKVQGTVRVHWTVNNTYYLRALIKEGGGGEYLQVGMSVGGKEYYPIPIAMFQVPTSSKQCALRRGGLGTLPALIGGGAYAKSCCMSGTDWNLVDGSACAVCQLGQYDHDADAATQCISCPAGRFSNLTGATSCDVCRPGTYAPAASTGASNCTACHPGQYDHDADAATPCISCPAGRFSSRSGAATSCGGVCQPGTYAPAASTRASNCTACHPGQYDHDADAATPCISCPAGRFSSLSGATSCGVCQSGTYAPPGSINASSCTACNQELLGKDQIVDPAKFLAKITQCSGTAQRVPVQEQLTYGCTDSGARNFDVYATIDNGTCAYDCGTLLNATGAVMAGRCFISRAVAIETSARDRCLVISKVAMARSNIPCRIVQGQPPAGWRPRHIWKQSDLVKLVILSYHLPIINNAQITLRYINTTTGQQHAANGGALTVQRSNVTIEHTCFITNAAANVNLHLSVCVGRRDAPLCLSVCARVRAASVYCVCHSVHPGLSSCREVPYMRVKGP
eukprot:COSAG01_NODE_908_length_12794_cov_119.794171_2_plen_1484_part_00